MLLQALIADEAFAVEVVLYAGKLARWGAEIHQDPRAHSADLGDFGEHGQIVFEDGRLVLLGPTLVGWAVHTGFGTSAELGDEDGLLIGDGPGGAVGIGGDALVPADVLVDAEDIECLTERVVDDLFVGLASADEQRGSDEAFGVEGAGLVGHGGEVFRAGRRVRSFVGDRPERDGDAVAIARDLFGELLFLFGVDGGIIKLECPVAGDLRPDEDAHAVGKACHLFVVGIVGKTNVVAA